MRATANAAEIRRAYVAAARRHHPDFHVNASPAERRKADVEMRRVNAAWAVLSDPSAKSAYDRSLAEARREAAVARDASTRRDSVRKAPSGASASFRPLHPDDDGVDPRLLDDTPFDGASPPPRWMVLLPVALVVGGAGVTLLGFLVSLRELVGAGLVLLALGTVAFLLAPFYVMAQNTRGRPR